MKFILLICLIGLVCSASIPSYIINHANDGSMKSQANQQSYSQQSFTDLLKYNFQVLSESSQAQQLIEEFGKGNLLNPVELNYMFVVEGSDNNNLHSDNAKLSLEQDSDKKILDSIFGSKYGLESLRELAKQFFPAEKRSPFYFYKSSNLSEQSLEKDFGIELKRDATTNQLYFFDNSTQKQIGKKFELNQCFEQAYPEFKLSQDKLIKNNSSLNLEINETNARNVESLLKDLCAVSKLSNMFKKSYAPNFVTFALKFDELENNEIVQDLLKQMYSKASANFEKSFGLEKVFGQVVYVDDLLDVLSEEDLSLKPRILSQTEANEDPEPTKQDVSGKQFQAWFTLFFVVILFFICYGLFTMELSRDTLLYAKFIIADGAGR